MCTGRLRARVPSATPRVVAKLLKHRFVYHKPSRDGSGKADAYYTGDAADFIWGIVFELSAAEKSDLDAVEGLGQGYSQKLVSVTDLQGKEYEAWTYYATAIESSLKPYSWYARFVIEGGKQHGLPLEYIEMLAKTDSVDDSDTARDVRNRAIRC